jgi:hypothetical protein
MDNHGTWKQMGVGGLCLMLIRGRLLWARDIPLATKTGVIRSGNASICIVMKFRMVLSAGRILDAPTTSSDTVETPVANYFELPGAISCKSPPDSHGIQVKRDRLDSLTT